MSCWPVTLMISQATGNYKGVRLASEQELYSHKLILASSFVFQLPPPHSSPGAQQNVYCDFGSKNTTEKLARSVCITKHSLKLDKANCLAFFPPRCKICITCLLFLSDFNISNFLPYQFFFQLSSLSRSQQSMSFSWVAMLLFAPLECEFTCLISI